VSSLVFIIASKKLCVDIPILPITTDHGITMVYHGTMFVKYCH